MNGRQLILRHPLLTILVVGLVISIGCDAFWYDPPPEPSADQRQAMRDSMPPRPVEQTADQESATASSDSDPRQVASVSHTVTSYRVWTLEETAADSLGRIGAAAVPNLVAALEDPDPAMRLRATRVLSRIGPDAVRAVPHLIQRLQDSDLRVRKSAVRALGQIGPEAKEAVPDLIRLLEPDLEAEAQ